MIRNFACAVSIAMSTSLFAAPALKIKAAEPSEELGTMPEKEYVTAYYPLPVDAVPKTPVARYTLNTRVNEYRWLKYEGAYALALGIRPIDRTVIEKEIAVGLIDTGKNKAALSFSSAAEKNPDVRIIVIDRLNLRADDFTGLAFRVRAKVKNASPSLLVALSGKNFSARLSGNVGGEFEDFTIPFKAKNAATIDRLSFVAGAADGEDFEQEFEIIDLRLLRPKPKARFTALPERRWTRKENVFGTGEPLVKSKCIDDVFKYARGEGAADSIPALPDRYELRPQLEKEKDGGFTVEYTTVKVLGKDAPAVKITLQRGPRCLLRFPVEIDGLDYNTFTFFAKVETFDGAKPLLGDLKPMLYGTNQKELNKPFDTFQISFFSKTHDFCDWTRWGLAQADYCQNKDMSSGLSRGGDGWRVFAYDIANSDPSNNKSSYYTKLTHWCFYYDNKKIPTNNNEKVVVTIADPRFTRGVMHTGGDLAKYREFLGSRDTKRVIDFDSMKSAFDPPKEGRLAAPIKFIEKRRPKGKIYVLPASFPPGATAAERAVYSKIVFAAANEFAGVLQRKFSMAADIRIETRLPPKKGAKIENSIIVGGNAYSKIDKAQYDADMKALAGKPGCAIRSDGTNVYIYASRYNYAGNVRGLAFALYELLENNTDIIYPHSGADGRPVRIFEPDAGGDFEIRWGDGFVHAPEMPEYSIFGVDGPNRVPGFQWEGSWHFARQRTRCINHWWGYGTEPRGDEKKGEPNDTWGRRADGTLMKPGCYTGHPCLIRVLDRARENYLEASAFARITRGPFAETQEKGRAFAWNSYDLHGLWVEDSISMCQCSECLTPIRLADGSTVGPESAAFRSTQYYANGSAMINAVNVFAKRDARIESIGYFWMSPIPLITVSRNYDIRFCPYIRKNYFVPIFAPMNDLHYRSMVAWSQQDVRLSLYEYFLCVGARPWADVAAWDYKAEVELGFFDWHAEAESKALSNMEKWVMERLLWGASGADVPKLRAYYLKRTFREAAEDVGRFYSLVMSAAIENLTFASPMEFEDCDIILRNAMRTKADGFFAGSVADELEKCIASAEKRVRDPMAAAEVRSLRRAWDGYRASAIREEKKWLDDVKSGAEDKEMKIIGAPE
ncbi:MAG: hypothetical protein IKC27_00855 [Kiritimatiellae bacterium]|nr:hypothetical protein [Kiritimatiellia bacterium]